MKLGVSVKHLYQKTSMIDMKTRLPPTPPPTPIHSLIDFFCIGKQRQRNVTDPFIRYRAASAATLSGPLDMSVYDALIREGRWRMTHALLFFGDHSFQKVDY